MTESLRTDRFAWLALGFGLIATWWLPVMTQPIVTFYKEWLFALALGLGGLILGPVSLGHRTLLRHPLVLAAGAMLAVLLVQSATMDGVWRRATLTGSGVAFFVFTMMLGRAMRQRRGDESLLWLARCLVIAALGSCVFAAMQLLWVNSLVPFVVGRNGDRITGNVAQANHFADLLWLGCVGAALLFARRKLSLPVAAVVVVTLQVFAVFSGSRMIWAYVAFLVLIGAVCLLRRPQPELRRLAAGLMALGIAHVLVVGAVSMSGMLEKFGITSAEQRAGSAAGEGSTHQRLWFWRAGIDAATQHPLLGIGAGRFPGHSHALAMQVADSPTSAADANAHNLFIHLAAELGVPLAIFVALCLVYWLITVWRRSSGEVNTVAALGMVGLILIHANLEHPLWYLYFLGLFGLLVGHVPDERRSTAYVQPRRESPNLLQFASFAVLLAAAAFYVQFARLESAMQVLLAQVRQGAAPQPTAALSAKLAAIAPWTPFGDYAEAIALISARPTQDNANDLAARCERSVLFGPSPHLLARCATALEVAGQSVRASFFANSLCKLYPGSEHVLIESMVFVEATSPAAGNLNSVCVDRVK